MSCTYYNTLGVLPDATNEELQRNYSAKCKAAGSDGEQLGDLHTAFRTLTSSRDEYDARLRGQRLEMDPGNVEKARARQTKIRRIEKKEGKAGPKWQAFQKVKTTARKRKLLQDDKFSQALVGEALQHVATRLLPRSHNFVVAVATCRRVLSRWPGVSARWQKMIAFGQTRIAALEGVQRDLEELRPRNCQESQAALASLADQLQKLQEEAEKVGKTTTAIGTLVDVSRMDPTPQRAGTAGSSEEDMIRLQLEAVLDGWGV